MSKQLAQGIIAALTARREDWLSWSIYSSQALKLDYAQGELKSVRHHRAELALELTMKDGRKLTHSWSPHVSPTDAVDQIFSGSKRLSSRQVFSPRDSHLTDLERVGIASESAIDAPKLLLDALKEKQGLEGEQNINIVSVYKYREKSAHSLNIAPAHT